MAELVREPGLRVKEEHTEAVRLLHVRLNHELEVDLKFLVRFDALNFPKIGQHYSANDKPLEFTYLVEHNGALSVWHAGDQTELAVQLDCGTVRAVRNGQLMLREVETVVLKVVRLLEDVFR